MAEQTTSIGGDPVITCRLHPSGFNLADSNFYSLTAVSDGSLYFTLSTHNIDNHGHVFRYDPADGRLRLICDLGEATGEAGKKMLPQGKSHSPFFELDGTLYMATHYGYFATTNEREEPAPVPAGYKPYAGGHLLSIDMATGRTCDLARADGEEGIITLNMDADRGRLYGLSWPQGFFLIYDLETGEFRNLGPVSRGGEIGSGDQYFCLVRSFAVDPRDGCVYFTNADGQVLVYSPDSDKVEPFGDLSLRCDILGCWDPHKPGHQGFNWRDILWHDESECFYGVHPKSGWLFRFDPSARRLDLVERICCDRLLRSGQFEPFRYGYLTLQLGPDRETLHYLTGTWGLVNDDGTLTPAADRVTAALLARRKGEHRPIRSADGRRLSEVTHLVTYNLRTRQRIDQGLLRIAADGRYPRMSQCHAVHPDGRNYTCPWIPDPSRMTENRLAWGCDLISFPSPISATA